MSYEKFAMGYDEARNIDLSSIMHDVAKKPVLVQVLAMMIGVCEDRIPRAIQYHSKDFGAWCLSPEIKNVLKNEQVMKELRALYLAARV